MKRLALLALAVTATSCAPVLGAVQREAGTLSIAENGSVLLKNLGKSTMNAPTILVEGTPDLTFTDAPCVRRSEKSWGCILPDVPANKGYRLLPATGGATWASATFYRDESGARPIYLEAR